MTSALVLDSSPGEVRAALLENGVLTEFSVFRRSDGPRLGDIYLGRVGRVEHGIEAAFVDIGKGPAGFLPLSGKTPGITEGAAVPVRIAAESVFGKGPRLAVAQAGDAAVPKPAKAPACLRRDDDLVAAALAGFATPRGGRIVAADAATYARLRALARGAGWADRIAPQTASGSALDEFDIGDQLEDALAPDVTLASGIELHVGELEALSAIDVDAAAFAPRKGTRATALSANIAAASAIAREIRLRNLGGLILVDFPRMKAAGDRRRLTDVFRYALTSDPVPSHLHGFTRAGLLEVTRERRRRPLSQMLLERGPPVRKSAETVAHEALRAALHFKRPGRAVTLAAAPDVIAWLSGPGKPDLEAAAAALHIPLGLRPDAGFGRERFEVERE